MTDSNSQIDQKAQIVQILAKFKADLLWDDIVGIFDIVPVNIKDELESQYKAALQASADKLKLQVYELAQDVEDAAYNIINGTSYSAEEIKTRLKAYGVEE